MIKDRQQPQQADKWEGQKQKQRQEPRQEGQTVRNAAAAALAAMIGGGKALYSATQEQIESLNRTAGNSAVEAMLRGGGPRAGGRIPQDAHLEDRVNRIRTAPPRLLKEIKLRNGTGIPNHIEDIAPHMGGVQQGDGIRFYPWA